MKQAGVDMDQCMEILRDKPAEFLVVSGDDALSMPQIACGMERVISVAANCFTKNFTEMIRLCLKGDFKTAKILNDVLIDGYHLLFSENNPEWANAVLGELGLCGNYLRLPLVPLSEVLHDRVNESLHKTK